MLISENYTVGELISEITADNQENASFHSPIELEREYCELIRSGDVDQVLLRFADTGLSEIQGIGVVSDDQLTQWKYMFVVSVTLARISAVQGGMDYELSCTMSDAYIRTVQKVKNMQELGNLFAEAMLDYTKAVSAAMKSLPYSRCVASAINYIGRSLHDSTNLESVAESCGYSTRHLSLQFHKETGMRVTDYIQQEKMKEACSLLVYSKRTISEISNLLQFSSQSHFTELFRKMHGCTPLAFRKAHINR